jgi:Asp-tRNA(Asn)/Glu-tRNA(Gln) amidotransferase A subunit family amidase
MGSMDPTQLAWANAADAARWIREGALRSEDLVQACLEQVRREEPRVQAWTFLDESYALEQARARDQAHRRGAPAGPLHGVPVGVKDIIDTGDMPTEDGTPLHSGRMPVHDAAVVAMLRQAGAVIMGKTVTTELSGYAPGKTRNPHNAAHTPGGSSSGSAAAVACGMVPLAVGSQLNGSVIRPASYCGVFGFKPTHGLVPRRGILKQSRALDQVGVFARSIEDLALVTEHIVGFDEEDPDTRPRARPPLMRVALEQPPLPPRLAFMRTPLWDKAAPDTHAAFAELVEHLGDRVEEFALPDSASQAWDWHRTIAEADVAASFEREYDTGRDRLSARLLAQIERGRAVSALEYQRALARIAILNEGFEGVFHAFDAILTPATTGTAPVGLEHTGDPAFCTLWTLCGMPAISLPLMQGENGLPLGVQLVAARGDDARLLRTANWLVRRSEAA